MKCVKTGAYVEFTNWPMYAACDIFQEGETIVIVTGSADGTKGCFQFNPLRDITHRVTITHGVYLNEARGVCVCPANALEYLA